MHRTCIDSQLLLSWFSGLSRVVIWQQPPGCCADAVEKELICSVFFGQFCMPHNQQEFPR